MSRRRDDDGLHAGDLVELRAALRAGCEPAEALAACLADHPVLGPAAAQARLGRPLIAVAGDAAPADPAADLLVRSLAVAERAGAGTVAAVDRALAAVAEEARLRRRVAVRTAQARGTVRLLTVGPVALWGVLVGLDRELLGFVATPLGAALTAAAALLVAGGRAWAGRIVAAAEQGPAAAERPAPVRPPADRAAAGPAGGGRAVGERSPRSAARTSATALAAGGAGGLAGWALLGPLAAPVAAVGCWWVAARRVGGRPSAPPGDAQAVELVACALAGGMSTHEALELAGRTCRRPAAAALTDAAARLRVGGDPSAALDAAGQGDLATCLRACGRWGAPAGEALAELAADLRARRRAAADEAVERAGLRIVAPTTVLILPGFALAVIPPVLATAFGGGG